MRDSNSQLTASKTAAFTNFATSPLFHFSFTARIEQAAILLLLFVQAQSTSAADIPFSTATSLNLRSWYVLLDTQPAAVRNAIKTATIISLSTSGNKIFSLVKLNGTRGGNRTHVFRLI